LENGLDAFGRLAVFMVLLLNLGGCALASVVGVGGVFFDLALIELLLYDFPFETLRPLGPKLGEKILLFLHWMQASGNSSKATSWVLKNLVVGRLHMIA
jgi:hypothetical protein